MTHNPFMKRNPPGSIDHGRKSEKKVAASLRANLTPASGATAGAKGDMVKSLGKTRFRIESKSTVNATMSLDLGWLVKIATEALQRGDNPMLTVAFVHPDGSPKNHGRWVMIPEYIAKEMFDALVSG